jgi:thymidylate kinase
MNVRTKIVSFLGPDGAGKTTIMALVEHELTAREVDFAHYYFAPGYLKRYRASGIPTVNTNPHAGRQYNSGLVLLKICLMLFEFNMGVPKVKRQNKLVLFDRFIHDLLVDPRRYRLNRLRWWMRVLLKLAPSPDLMVIITAPAKIIQSRKQEVSLKETERQVLTYKSIANQFSRFLLIENVGQPEDAAIKIVSAIFDR